MSDQPSLRINLRRSPLVTGFLIAAHALTLLPLWLADLAPPVLTAAVLAVVAHGGWSAWRFGWLGASRSVAALEAGRFRCCTIVLQNGERIAGAFHSSSVVTGSLVVIALRPDAAHGVRKLRRLAHVIVAPDMLAEEEFRCLRVMLKWSPPQTRDFESSPSF